MIQLLIICHDVVIMIIITIITIAFITDTFIKFLHFCLPTIHFEFLSNFSQF